ncbi:MAG: proline dehydrogenase [Candidatus Marinimicrobia bacterium]|nr:proline dehydrogenase [Candidatus Neomarinimicrobiota bacterium]
MRLFNLIITKVLPFLPKWFAKPFAKSYVAGETFDEALKKVRELNERGFKATLDILGEHINHPEEAKKITAQYCLLYDKIDEASLDCSISVKPTHIGLSISQNEAIANMTKIANKACDLGNFLRIDMENSKYTDQTLEILNECRNLYENVGVAIQAYLYRSENDIDNFSNNHFNLRICKGIYNEPEKIAYKNYDDIQNNFLLLAKKVALKGGFCGYATHDLFLIDRLLEWINEEKIPSNLFEFQVLYGVPMGNKLDELIKKGFSVRVYVPFGPDWFDYSIRRLKENPNLVGYVLSNLIKS